MKEYKIWKFIPGKCGFMYRTSFNKPFCYRACVQGKQYFWYIKIKYRIILDDK